MKIFGVSENNLDNLWVIYTISNVYYIILIIILFFMPFPDINKYKNKLIEEEKNLN